MSISVMNCRAQPVLTSVPSAELFQETNRKAKPSPGECDSSGTNIPGAAGLLQCRRFQHRVI